jgi:hypothetical protein
MRLGQSGQISRTRAVNTEENSADLIPFVSSVSQQRPGTP